MPITDGVWRFDIKKEKVNKKQEAKMHEAEKRDCLNGGIWYYLFRRKI